MAILFPVNSLNIFIDHGSERYFKIQLDGQIDCEGETSYSFDALIVKINHSRLVLESFLLNDFVFVLPSINKK